MTRRWAAWCMTVTLSLAGGYLYAKETDPAKGLDEAIQQSEFDVAKEMADRDLAGVRGETSDAPMAKSEAAVARLHALYSRSPEDPSALRALSERALWLYQRKFSTPGAADAASETCARLALLQVQQNRRIIELLEQLVKAKSSGQK